MAKIKLLLYTVSILLQINLFAQDISLMGIVKYGHKESFGMGAPIGVDYNAELIFNSKSSTYTYAKDSLEGERINDMKRFVNEKKVKFLIQKYTTKEGRIYNLNREENLIRSRDIGNTYVKDIVPYIKWKILSETKKIGAFECTKATSNFSGREYTAWFSIDIPLPYGPWKLTGLPGLILEAYDTDKEIYFYFKSIEYPSKKELNIIVPDPKTNTTMDRQTRKIRREWVSSEDFKKEMIERHRIGTKMGRMFNEQFPNTQTGVNKNPMRNVFIEIFDEN